MQEHYCLITKSEIPNKQCNMTVMFLSENLVVVSFDATPQDDIFGLNRDTTSMCRTHIHLLKHLKQGNPPRLPVKLGWLYFEIADHVLSVEQFLLTIFEKEVS